MGNIFFDCSGLVTFQHSRLTGIQRVELGIHQGLERSANRSLILDRKTGKFHRITIDDTENTSVEELDFKDFDGRTYKQNNILALLLLHMFHLYAIILQPSLTRVFPRLFCPVSARWTATKLIYHAFGFMTPQRIDSYARIFDLNQDGRYFRWLRAKLTSSGPVIHWTKHEAVSLSPGDVLFHAGSLWDHPEHIKALEEQKRQHGFSIMLLIHDVIPLQAVEQVDHGFHKAFSAYFEWAARHADHVVTTSCYCADEVRHRFARIENATCKHIFSCPITGGHVKREGVLTRKLRESGLVGRKFVLFVSSISFRKNHIWMELLWRHLLKECGDDLPVLVYAGQNFHGGDRIEQLDGSELGLAGKIKVLLGPSDDEVAWLYQNCLFTVFPSMSEGWGMPISESLAFGKYCLAADNTSLVEAGAGLIFNANLLDGMKWAEEVKSILYQPSYLAGKERAITVQNHARTWDDFCADLLQFLPRQDAMARHSLPQT